MSLAFWQTEIIHDDLWVRLIYVAHLSVMNIGRQLWWWWRRSFSCCRLYKNCTVLWTATCIMHTEFPVTFFTVNYAYFQPFYTGCPRRNGQNFGRVFLMLKYKDITQKTYIQSWTVTDIMAREVWKYDSCYTLTDCQIHIKTGRNMWFL